MAHAIAAETNISWSRGNGKATRGSGNVVERTVATAAFDKVVAQAAIRVVLGRGPVQTLNADMADGSSVR